MKRLRRLHHQLLELACSAAMAVAFVCCLCPLPAVRVLEYDLLPPLRLVNGERQKTREPRWSRRNDRQSFRHALCKVRYT